MADQTPALHHRPGQPLPWQWRAPIPTTGDMAYSRDAEDHASTYLAGFRDREAAEVYGRARGWHDVTDTALAEGAKPAG